ncbi:DUF2479 domain-containing protein [Lactobacillus reuteri]|uniref:BppU family phage baseplate upper protein n=1 Tax=Limosilactobacillus reuteri TaxID=1598 RepID=UPI001651F46B|nr:BppU family phage baseplate upper protein [Limosilactobacillus reuteri]MBC6909748.1 DUF2479 domain-containing protein [Limosilactobacillus reuteri]
MLTLKYIIGQDQRKLTPFELHEGDTFDLSKDPDVNKNKVQAMQYNSGMDEIFLELYEDQKDNAGALIPFDLSGANIMFEGWKPDGKYIVDPDIMTPVSLQQGQCRINLPDQAFAVYGSYKQAFFRIYRDNKSIATLEFTFNIRADMVQGQIKSVDWIGPVHEILEKTKEDYESHKKSLDEAVSNAIAEYTKEMNTLKALGASVDTSLAGLLQKIKDNNLFTQAEADAFKQKIQEQLDKALTKVDEKLASIFGKGQNPVALSVYWTNWDDNKRQYTQFSVDQMKTSIDEAANYVQGIVVPLRLENDGNQFHVLGNLADIKQGIDYAVSKGLKLMSVKIHCVATLEQITNYGIDNFFNDYANSVAAACTSLGATSDVKLTILNERWDLVNDEKYADKVVKLINDLKTATKLSVGISFVQLYLGDAQSAVYSACDFIGLNAYPTVTDLKRSVPFALIASAWQQVAPIIQSLIALYHKPIFLSETGIEDNYEALEDPSNWKVGSQYNSQGEVQYMYFKGLIESGILDYTTEMWIWFGITSSKAQALLRQYMNGVIN